MRWWSRVDERILLHQRETQGLKRERVSGGKAGKLLHVVGGVGTIPSSPVESVLGCRTFCRESSSFCTSGGDATRKMPCFPRHACQDAVVLSSMPAHEALISSAIFRTPSDATTTSRPQSMAQSSASLLSP